MSALPPVAVLTDIEGTTTPVAFVRGRLFPYARARLKSWLSAHRVDAEIASELAEVRRMVPGQEPLLTLLHWMDQNATVTPLKTLQARIWNEGYADGTLRGELFPDVAPSLQRWRSGGLRLHVYSTGSVEAQKSIFAHSVAGDLSGLFSGFFDTRVGNKQDPSSYGRLAIAMNLPPAEVLFLSRVEAELDAAAAAGLRTCQVARAEDGTAPTDRHVTAADFAEVAVNCGLPRAT